MPYVPLISNNQFQIIINFTVTQYAPHECACICLSQSVFISCVKIRLSMYPYCLHVYLISAFQLRLLVRLVRLYHGATGLLLSVNKYLITFHPVVWLYITALSLVLHSSDYYRFSRSLSLGLCARGYLQSSPEG